MSLAGRRITNAFSSMRRCTSLGFDSWQAFRSLNRSDPTPAGLEYVAIACEIGVGVIWAAIASLIHGQTDDFPHAVRALEGSPVR